MSHKHRCEQSLSQINLKNIINSPRKHYHPSPYAWEDQVLYFLMLDRFSDGKEKGYLDNNGAPVTTGQTPLYTQKTMGMRFYQKMMPLNGVRAAKNGLAEH